MSFLEVCFYRYFYVTLITLYIFKIKLKKVKGILYNLTRFLIQELFALEVCMDHRPTHGLKFPLELIG